jgi:phospholipase C
VSRPRLGRLAAALGTLVVLATTVATAPVAFASSPTAETLRTTTPIKHFLVLMQSGHSFDNYFGTYPGADGIPKGTCMPVTTTQSTTEPCSKPFPIGGKAASGLRQSRAIHDAEVDGGKMDGFVAAFAKQGGGSQAMGYYDAKDIPYYWNVADNYVLFDRMFAPSSGGSVWNHMFWVTGTPGNPDADALLPGGFGAVETIFDRLQQAGISWKFYAQNYQPNGASRTSRGPGSSSQSTRIPLLNFDRFRNDPALNSHIVDVSQYYLDAKNGTLPAVSFLVPSGSGEHPPGSIQAGERFVSSLVDALMTSRAWPSSAFMWTYDGWGGWYDHVRPPVVDGYGYGLRTPGLLVSPYAKKGYVDHTTLDSTSELRFIENNWGVAPLAARDKAASDITSAFDFASAPRPAVLLGASRSATPQPSGRTSAVYPGYGLALLLVPLLVALAAVGPRRARRGA